MVVPTWSLKVEDYGPIKSGTVTLASLTVFVGPNNSGKSYMASLIWMLLRGEKTLLDWPLPSGPRYDAAAAIARAIRLGQKSLVSGPDWTIILAWLNEFLGDHAAEEVRRVLTNPFLQLRSIEAELTESPKDLRIGLDPFMFPEGRDTPAPSTALGSRSGNDRLTLSLPSGEAWPDNVVDEWILLLLARRFAPAFRNPIYIPAARTGLMLAYPVLVASLIGSMASAPGERVRDVIPAPVREFLVSLQYASPAESNHASVAGFLEREILAGEIGRDDLGKFYYVQAASGTSLPLHAASSMVTELAPFVWLLKGHIDGCLIFEEPEAHLHLSAQRTLARALVRLVNAGTPVLVTTHSDTFLQQINILMQLHAHPRRDELAVEFGYEGADMLDPTKALGYMFHQDGGQTRILALEKNPEGFVEPLMNTQIAELTSEVIRMERA